MITNILLKERQLLTIKNQNLEHKYRSEIGVSEYKAVINHQEHAINDLRYFSLPPPASLPPLPFFLLLAHSTSIRHVYRRNQGALVATQERKSRLEKSLINLHTTISDHERTITSLHQITEEMRVQVFASPPLPLSPSPPLLPFLCCRVVNLYLFVD